MDSVTNWKQRLGLGVLVIAAIVALLFVFVGTLTGSRHAKDAYLWFGSADIEHDPAVVMIDGLPRVRYPGSATPQDNPVTIAQWGLEQEANGNDSAALRAANWLVEHQRSDGAWAYRFDFAIPWAATTMRAPWISAMTQGQAMALLVRASRIAGDSHYLQAARRAILPFQRSVAAGGVMRRWRGHVFYEEYPTRTRPTLVLNGFLFSILGVRQLALATGDPGAWNVWREGEATAAALIPQYAFGAAGSSYSLAHLTGGPPQSMASGGYPALHVALARRMYRITGRPVYERMAARWARGLPSTAPWSNPILLGSLLTSGLLMLAWLLVRWRRLPQLSYASGSAKPLPVTID